MPMPRLSKTEATEKLCLALPASLDAWIEECAREIDASKSYVIRQILRAEKARRTTRQAKHLSQSKSLAPDIRG